MGKSACLAFLRLEFGPDMNERGAEFIVEVDRVFLGHVGGENKGENPVVDASFDGMNPHDLPRYDQMEPFSNVANGFLLEGHGASAVEGEPKGEHAVVRFLGHDVCNGAELDRPDVVLVQNGNGGRSFQENSGPHGYFFGIGTEFSAGGEGKGRQKGEKKVSSRYFAKRGRGDGNLGFVGKRGSVFTRLLHEFRIYINIKSIQLK